MAEGIESLGHPLDPSIQGFFESKLGHSFTNVRIHNNTSAAESARRLGADAYSFGEDLVFAGGKFRPRTKSGNLLLAHELVHTVQQRNTRKTEEQQIRLSKSYDIIEQEASSTAERLMSGAAPVISSSPPSDMLLIARQENQGEPSETARELWEENLRLWREFLEENGISIEEIESVGPPTSIPTNIPVAAGALPAPLPDFPSGPIPVQGPGGKVIPFPRPPPVVEPVPEPVPTWAWWIIPIIILLWPSETAPPWMDEINPITGRPYHSPDEYDMVKGMPQRQQEALRRWVQRLQQPQRSPQTGPLPAPAPQPDRRRRNLRAYPLYWTLLLPPPIFRNGLPWTAFARTHADRDEDQAKQARMQLQWRQFRDPDFDATRYHVHHIIPLFLGGPDDILVNNGIIWPASVHLHGHRVLRNQPQMSDPIQTAPLPPISPDMYDHIAGTPYELVGFKD